MTQEFIPYEQALALKELGFDEPCLGWYLPEIVEKGNIPSVILGAYLTNWTKFGGRLSAPLYQQAFRWFREKFNYDIIVSGSYNLGKKYYYRIETPPTIGMQSFGGDYKTYEEAEISCLIKLIEIVKQ